jgi:cytochrome c553
MQKPLGPVAAAFLAFFAVTALAEAADPPPQWAYPVNTPGAKAAPDDGTLKRVPGSDRAFTLTQLRDLFNVPDWHPQDHPQMPDAVARGRPPGVFACGFCHLPTGLGRPENASLAGLPLSYIVQQVSEMKSGARKTSEPGSLPIALMVQVAQSVADEDLIAAAEYFSALQPRPWIRVVEAAAVPKTRVGGWMLIPAEGGGTETIGNRIIEMPEDLARTELRDSRSGFVAYVPPGSLRKGEALAATGGGKTAACSICHGAGLKGLGPVPALAGRSPSYLYRQLHDIRHGMRNGAWAELMKGVVATMSEEDMIAAVAYAASLAP